jgi:very-short-patch-repair endonuclease
VDFDALAQLAHHQFGVFARWQAMDLGFTKNMIDKRIETKQWRRVVGRSVLTALTTRLSEEGRAWAIYLACGRGAVLSGPSALRRHGVDAPLGDKIWVTVPPERHLRIDGVRTIREVLLEAEVVELEGMRVTTLSRSVIDTLRVLPERFGRDIADRALLRGWITAEQLAASVEAFTGRRGNIALRLYDERARSGARSEAERRLHHILEDAGITGWVADFKIYDAGGNLQAVLDLAFEREKLAVEIDGFAFHSDPERFQHDRTRQNWLLVADDWRVLRFTWDDLVGRAEYVARTIKAELAKHTDR